MNVNRRHFIQGTTALAAVLVTGSLSNQDTEWTHQYLQDRWVDGIWTESEFDHGHQHGFALELRVDGHTYRNAFRSYGRFREKSLIEQENIRTNAKDTLRYWAFEKHGVRVT